MYEDASRQVTRETTKLTKNKDVVKNYSYDSAGNKSAFAVKVEDDTKLSLQYNYDGESKLTAVTDDRGNQIVGYSYDMDGNLAERTVPGNNLTTTYTYDYQNRLTAMKNQTGNAGVISQYTSEYLANGQKSKEISDVIDKDGKKSQKTATYTYDLLGCIKKETKTGGDLVYADQGTETEKQYYVTDPHGNVVQLTNVSGKITKNYEYDSFGNEANPDSKDDIRFVTVGSTMTK